jgi:[glutamine synthetase] adenylyltransferase / [glutamine synthetase]-adenylyl-L-tyrosine phosphorylase
VISEESKQTIQSLCSGVGKDVIEEFFARMDDDYFTTFSPEEIATHIQMASALGARNRIAVRVRSRASSPGVFDIVIVGFDYLSEFSIFCGLLSAFGLDIRAGNIYSFSKRANRPSPAKIVDVFSVSLKRGEVFEAAAQRNFEQELHTFANLLATGAGPEARARLNRFLTERIETMKVPLGGLLSPVQIRFDNEVSVDWTLMEVHSEDSFAFLYAVSNALAMHGVDIHKVKIRNVAGKADDQFFVAGQWGRRIEEPGAQEKLKMAVRMMKQFTSFLPEAPDPGKAMRHFDQFLDKAAENGFPNDVISFLAGGAGMTRLARVLGSSDFLWDDFLSTHFSDLVPLLGSFEIPKKESLRRDLRSRLASAPPVEAKKRVLNDFKDRQAFRIDVHHLLEEEMTLTDFSNALTDLAEVVVDESARICSESLNLSRYAVCGLGKFGGREMGYASDLELMFIHDEPASTPKYELLARQTIEFIEARPKGIFHIDLRLRPYGDAGVWSIPFDEFEKYYGVDGTAAPFERQALIKLRWVAGDEDLGRRAEAHRDRFTYSGARWDWENALHLRQRQIHELVKSGRINVKYSAGGIVDVEYAVQYLQLLHGSAHPELRLPNTVEALEQLRILELVDNDEYELLSSAYLFLRKLIDGLRVVRGDASDLVLPPEDSDEFKSLARRVGYRGRAADIRETMGKVHEYFVGRFQ